MNIKTHKLVLIALFTAIMFILTAFVAIPIGSFGYINLSDCMIMIFATILDPFSLVFIAAVGTSLADLFLGFAYYALFTLIIKSLEALLIFKLLKKDYKKILAFSLGAVVMLVGYGLSDVVLSQDIFIFISSFLANLPQALICVFLATLLFGRFKKLEARFQ